MIRVKVCGMHSLQDVESCVAAGVDAVGFIFAAGPSCLQLDEGLQLTRHVPPFVTTVGVFAGNDEAFVREATRRCRLDVLQFSGGETPQFCGAFGKPTVIVLHVRGPHYPQIPDAQALHAARAIGLMVDSSSDGKAGGTGIRVDTDVAAALAKTSPLPFILAGGLTPANVAAAVALVQPWGVDVRSGVERLGKKEPSLVAEFVREAKRLSANNLGDLPIAHYRMGRKP